MYVYIYIHVYIYYICTHNSKLFPLCTGVKSQQQMDHLTRLFYRNRNGPKKKLGPPRMGFLTMGNSHFFMGMNIHLPSGYLTVCHGKIHHF